MQTSKVFADLGMNITRVSYNKAIDSNMLFIDADGTTEQHEKAAQKLSEYGYLNNPTDSNVILFEFLIKDAPGEITAVLELLKRHAINISFVSSQENGTGYQQFKMGLFVENNESLTPFIEDVTKICKVRVIDYNHSEKSFDNSIFYNSFAKELIDSMGLEEASRHEIMINANLMMQMLDDRGLSPYRTFDSISRCAALLSKARGEGFVPRITEYNLTEDTGLTLIEPPCGSNTAIIKNKSDYLFVDCGYSCYKKEMLELFRKLIPDFDTIHKRIIITHADLDHCGLLNCFDEVITNSRSAEILKMQYEGLDDARECTPAHRPYIKICKQLTSYAPVNPEKVSVAWKSPESQTSPLTQIGYLEFADLGFEVYEGFGGHLPGEMIYIDYNNHLAFTGDVFVNLKGMTTDQAEYNKCAPILMTSVDITPEKCALERSSFFKRLGNGNWKIFGAHGGMKEYDVGVLK